MSKTQVKLYEMWSKNKNEDSISEYGQSSSAMEPQCGSSLFLVELEPSSSSSVAAEPQHISSSSSIESQQNSPLFLVEPECGSSSSIVGAKSSLYFYENNIIVLQRTSLSSSSTTLLANPHCQITSEGKDHESASL